ncbi:MAG TPA: putative Ig domain-containing protein [Candidatus Acidoferrales bacterium]|nr:putative Ig domain-containing protein [Candidatus Acidoferrales bacterium]
MFCPWPLPLRVSLAAVACFATLLLLPTVLIAACVGDCNADGVVTVDELLLGVNIALGSAAATACAAVDANGDGEVTINELLAAVQSALNGCPPRETPPVTETGTTTPTQTGTPGQFPTTTPTPTATESVNHPPDVPCFGIYHGYPGSEIGLPIDATDPDGDALRYTATNLPDGAVLDAQTGVFSWTPTAQQFGTFYVQFTVTDNGAPPQATGGLLTLRVAPTDLCQTVTCNPATGCESTPLPLSQSCCVDLPPRMTEPFVPCPEGRVLFVGRNSLGGIGRLQDCDLLPVINSGQTSAMVRLNIEARCVNTSTPVTVRARLLTQGRGVVFDNSLPVFLDPGPDGYSQRTAIGFPLQIPGPFFDLDSVDADLTVTLTDTDGVVVTSRVRPTLGFVRPDDLTDMDAPPPLQQTGCP